MKTGIEAITDVWKLVNVPSVKTLVNGVIIRQRRPKASNLFDVVVNCLGLSNQMLQSGIININIHGTNVVGAKFGTFADDQFPDLDKLDAIAKVITPLVDTIFIDSWHLDIDRTAQPFQDTDGSWYVNIRLNYYSALNNFKNI